MPRIISFAETTPALLAGEKTVTRREWQPQYAARWKAGDEALAYSKNPRAGGKPVARIRLTAAPRLESTATIPPEDWEREGFRYLEGRNLTLFGGMEPADVWNDWLGRPRDLWVVRFEVIEVFEEVKP